MHRQTDTDYLSLAAITSAGAMIAFQVGGKATRDALFLSNFPVTALPGMLVASAALSIFAVLIASRIIARNGPGGVIPYAFGASAILLVAEWIAFTVSPGATAVVFYLHMAVFGAILVSGFWSMVGELFDPRTAKTKVGRIGAGGTVGGLIGGLLAERTGAMLSISSMLPLLAILHLVCAVVNQYVASSLPAKPLAAKRVQPDEITATKSGFRALMQVPYLKNLAGLVLFATIAETLLDYVLKTQASAAFGQGGQLIRFFALFYTGISIVTFLVQSALSRYSLQQLGLTGTMSTMPFMVTVGGLGSLIWPGLFSVGFVRGVQSALRSSLFRSGYELLYTPVPHAEKRGAKTIVDVGFDKLGDAFGGAVIRLVLSLGLAAPLNNYLLILTAVVLSVLSLILTSRLSKGYIATLEKSLLNQAAELDLLDIEERTTRSTMLRTFGTIDLGAIRSAQQIPAPTTPAVTETAELDPLMKRTIDLRSENAAVVRRALAEGSLDPLLIAPVIRLLARDNLSEDAIRILRTATGTAVGQMTDALLNTGEDFAIRRRIPRVLAAYPSERTVEALLRGLSDERFEVRFSCGRALSRICVADQTLRPKPENIYAAAIEEIMIAERLTEMPRMLDSYDDQADSPSADSQWNSTDVRLEHIFRLLSLCLPSEPLHIAFQALHTDDKYLRGTALEYLDSILPSGVRDQLWQFLEGPRRPVAGSRPTQVILEELMTSRQRIATQHSSAARAPSRTDR
jgi:ATP:ADP antiporter, AAA family